MLATFALLTTLLSARAEASLFSHPTVRVEQGLLRGRSSHGSVVFKGVPFAAPPVGPLRWSAPTTPPAWPGVRSATQPGPQCLQPIQLEEHPQIRGSEDCLTLNLWAPKADSADAKLRPVMVYIHGGFFLRGDKEDGEFGVNAFDGSELSRRSGAIVVTINYRLGVMGFAAHPLLSAESAHQISGNYGILDQIEALRWLRKNVARFGGDPAQVTVFGESAGAASVLILAASPVAHGLFRAAIVESGYVTRPTLAQAERFGDTLLRNTGCETLACLRALPGNVVAGAISSDQSDGKAAPLLPNIDGFVLPKPVYDIFEAGSQNPVALLIGSNSNESSTLAKSLYGRGVANDEELATFVNRVRGEGAWRKISPLYSTAIQGSAQQALIQLSTDTIFTCPARRLLRAATAAPQAPVYRYVFSHTSHSPLIHAFGAGHGLELPYVFHFTPRIPVLGFTRAERDLSFAIQDHWASFASTLDPGWPQYSMSEGEAYLDLDEKSRVGTGFRNTECDAL